MIQTKHQLFSTQFLTQLRSQINGRTKTSKAMVEAMKSLSILNQNNKVNILLDKKKIAQLCQHIQNLKEQNCLLVQLLQSTKQQFLIDYSNKQKRLEEAYQRQAKLTSQNEGLKAQVQKLKLQLNMMSQKEKELEENQQLDQEQQSENLQPSDFQIKNKQNHVNIKQWATKMQQNSSIDLALYLKSQTSIRQFKSEVDCKSQQDQIFFSLQKEKNRKNQDIPQIQKQQGKVSDEYKNNNKRGFRNHKIYKSQHMNNISMSKTVEQQIYMKILYQKNQQSDLLSA